MAGGTPANPATLAIGPARKRYGLTRRFLLRAGPGCM
jgi:hypothetical protein